MLSKLTESKKHDVGELVALVNELVDVINSQLTHIDNWASLTERSLKLLEEDSLDKFKLPEGVQKIPLGKFKLPEPVEPILPNQTGFWLWYIHDFDYFKVGCVQVLQDPAPHVEKLKASPKPDFYVYQSGYLTYTLYHCANDDLPPMDENHKPKVDGWLPFDFRVIR